MDRPYRNTSSPRVHHSNKPSTSYSQFKRASSSQESSRGLARRREAIKSSTIQSDEPYVAPQVSLVTNAFSLTVSKLDLIIHEYQLTVTASEGYKNIPDRILNRNFVARSIRKLVMKTLVPNLCDISQNGGSVVIESNLEAIYSTKLFKFQASSSSPEHREIASCSQPGKVSDQEFVFKHLLVETDLLNLLHVDIVINYKRSSCIGSPKHSHALLTSILHHKLLVDMLRFGSVYYLAYEGREPVSQANRLDLMSQHIMGYSLSGLRNCSKDQTLVVINCCHSYITGSHRLIDLLATFITCRPIKGLRLNHSASDLEIERTRMSEIATICGSEEWFASFCSILTGFKCKSIGLKESSCVNLRFSLTKEPATTLLMNDDKLEPEEGGETVQTYYRRLGTNLNYPNLPCLIAKAGNQSYYPLEMCTLLPDQKVPIFRLSAAARNDLTALNKLKPDMTKTFSSNARNEIMAINREQCGAFGVHLSEQPVEAIGSNLEKPTLQFRDQLIDPNRDYWESGIFPQPMQLVDNWVVVNTVPIDTRHEDNFFQEFSRYCVRHGFKMGKPYYISRPKKDLSEDAKGFDNLIDECHSITQGRLKFVMFIIDSSSTLLNRLIHLSFDEHSSLTATCLRADSIMNERQKRSIFRTLIHKLNARLGGTNLTYHSRTLDKLNLACEDIMVIGLDVTHPDNELNGVSIVGCAYTFSQDLFKHRSLVWPQTARAEIIGKVDSLMERILYDYYVENKGRLPKHIIVYRDGVSHEEFEKVRLNEVSKAQSILIEVSREANQAKPNLSFIIAQKRHTMRFFWTRPGNIISNPPSGTLIDQDVVSKNGKEFYLYSNTNPQATARPLHYHVLLDGMGIEKLQKLTFFLCFNFGKCSGTLSMPSSLKYAHNAAYDARNRVIAAREFSESKFYTSKFFC